MGRTKVSLLFAAAALIAAPALAQVKAGVDAWSKGDYDGAIRQWQGPAAQGDADALFNLGQAYKLGRGVGQDLTRAEALFGQAAAKGHIQAADNYGLLLFQRGEHAKALPYIGNAAGRGDPRAQYLLGLAHFNGENAPRDWVRAYALVSLAAQAGLPQARAALGQMDQYIVIAERQQGVALSAQLASEANANRARQLAAVDLGASLSEPEVRAHPQVATVIPPAPAAARLASPAPVRTAAAASVPQPKVPASVASNRPSPVAAPASPPPAASGGIWRVQLGAFSVAGNAEALWSRLRSRPELSGRPRLLVSAGQVTKLQAGGFASQSAAQTACARLSAAGVSCLVTRG